MVYIITALAIFHFQYWLFLTKIKSKTAIYWLYIWSLELMIGAFMRPFIPYWIGLLVLLLVFDGIMLYKGEDRNVKGGDYLLILGFGLKNDKPTPTLIGRLNKAIEYVQKNLDIQIVVSGGYTGGQISEAQAMKEYLVEQGISESKILIEEKSTTTVENFEFMAKTYPQLLDRECIIVSSEYHLFRSKGLAKRFGFRKIKAIGSKSEKVLLLNHLLKEKYLIITKK